jgi:hypothetical protein
MPGSTQPTKLLDQIAVVVGAITGIGARVAQGKKRFSEVQNLEADILALTEQSQGYFAFKLGGRSAGNQTVMGGVDVDGILLVHLDKDTTTDANTLFDLAESIVAALGRESNFTSVGARPSKINYIESDDDFEDGIAVFIFACSYEVGPVCGV